MSAAAAYSSCMLLTPGPTSTNAMRPRKLAAVFGLALSLAVCLHAQADSRSSGSRLGIGLIDISADRASALKLGESRGVEVRTVQENSPAAAAGIETGDILLTYNGEEILSAPQLGRLVGETPPGRKVKIQYWRQGKTKTLVAAPAASESAPPEQYSAADLQAWGVTNVPKMLMIWDNLPLGIECEPIDSQLAEYFGVPNGILVRQIAKGMAGEKAGIRAGDVIVGVDTRTVTSTRDFVSYLRTQGQPGKSIVIKLVRDHKPRTIAIGLNE